MRGVSKAKEAIPFVARLVLESVAFLYSKANEALQAHFAAAANRMNIPQEIPVRSPRQFRRMRPRFVSMCVGVALIMGMGAPAGWGQQAPEKPRDLELSRGVRPWEFLAVTGTRVGLLANER